MEEQYDNKEYVHTEENFEMEANEGNTKRYVLDNGNANLGYSEEKTISEYSINGIYSSITDDAFPSNSQNVALGAEKGTNEEKEFGEEFPPVGFFSLFRYSSCFDKALIIFAFVIGIASGISVPAANIFFGKITDKYITFNDTNSSELRDQFLQETSTLCMYYALLGCVFLFFNYIMVTFFSLAAANQAFRIRCLFMKSILKQEIGWFDRNQTGDFASRITGDLTRIQDGVGEKVGICINSISSTVLCVASGIYYGWKMALVILCGAPILTIAMAAMSKFQAKVSKEELQGYGAAAAVAEEVLSSIRTVVSFGGEKKEIQRYENLLVPARKKGIKRGLMTSIGAAFTWFCIFAGYALAFWYGVKLIIEEKDQANPTYTGGTLIIIFFNVGTASMFVGQTAPYFEAFSLARGAAAKIFSIIDRQPSIDSSSEKGIVPASLEGYIQFKNVCFSYPSRPTVQILKGLSLNIKPGETVALVGQSGCGKSTVIQLILRFYDTDAGSVGIDGCDVKDLNVGWLRDHIGMVGQEPVLFSTTIKENIMYGKLDASEDEVIKAAKVANVHDFIESLPLKYETLVGERGTQLSGGQKQRIAIARALIKNPRILLLDEATSALDTESEAVVQAALDEARLGRTTVVIAHRLSTIRTADKIVVLKDGEVKEIGTHEELMQKKEIYYQLVLIQTKEAEEEKDEEDFTEPHTSDLERSSELAQSEEEMSLRQTSATPRHLERVVSFPGGAIQQQVPNARTLDRQISCASGRNDSSLEEIDFEDKIAPLSQMRLVKISAPEWPFVLVGGISALVMGLHFPAFGIVFGDIFGVLSHEDENYITSKSSFLCLIFLLFAITSFIFTFLQTFMFTVAGERLTSRLRKLVFANILTQDISFFDHPKNSVGSLCSRLTSDASNVQGATGSRISILLQAASSTVLSIAIGLYYNYKMGLVVFAFVPFVLLSTYMEGRVVRGHMEKEKAGMEKATKIAVEVIENIRTVASLHQERMFYFHFHDALLNPHRRSRFKSHVRGLAFGFVQGIQAIAYAGTMYYGSILVSTGEIPYSNLLKIIKGVLYGTTMVGQAIAFTPDYQKAKIAASRILKMLDMKPTIDAFSNEGIIKDNLGGYIGFQRVHFNYPSRKKAKILRGLDLETASGKTVALVGSSGCGKSTCVQLIERFYDAQHGKVLIDDDDVRDLNVASHRSHVGLVSQEPVLFSYSIAENIAYGNNSRKVDMNEIIEVARQANIHNFIASLPQGYDTPVGDKGAQLSGGQKQRIAIARALRRNPKILLLDEATSALDAESEKVVQESLDKARSGRTCLIIAHRLTTVQNADCIMVIHKGRIVEKGTHQELLSQKGHYYNLHNIQGSQH